MFAISLFAEAQRRTEKGQSAACKIWFEEFLAEGEAKTDDDRCSKTKPIADLFPETTIMFTRSCRLHGLSSVREACASLYLQSMYVKHLI
jgi:hypothetical protein